jgi:hypothetical protein
MRGSGTSARRTGRRSELAQIDVLLYLVENGPGRSALELSQAIYGERATELRVQQDLTRLVSSDEIERRGIESLIEPDTYHPIPLRRRD